jgi:AraC-like DNA-binding protein
MCKTSRRAILRFCLEDDAAVYLGKSNNRQVIAHQAISLILACDQPFELSSSESRGLVAHAALLPSLVPHRFADLGGDHLFLFFDADSLLGQQLCGRYAVKDAAFEILPPEPFVELRTQFLKEQSEPDGIQQALRSALKTLWTLSGPTTLPSLIDPRVQRVLALVRQKNLEKVSAVAIASILKISTGRLAQLFKLQVGMPLRKYVLWQRLKRATEAAAGGLSLTDAAYAGGFADAAHFSRTFAATFGTTPSNILRDERFVQVEQILPT